MNKLRFLILFLSLFISCNKSAYFDKEGVSFTCPKGWEISEEEDIDGGYYVSVEKSGFDESGLVTFTWVNEEIDLGDWMESLQKELRDNMSGHLTFNNLYASTYNGIETITLRYVAYTMGVKHIGTIYVFHSHGKTFAIIQQEAKEDKAKNIEGFQMIEDSFKIQ